MPGNMERNWVHISLLATLFTTLPRSNRQLGRWCRSFEFPNLSKSSIKQKHNETKEMGKEGEEGNVRAAAHFKYSRSVYQCISCGYQQSAIAMAA